MPESLLTIAQLALGLAGFSGVILVFGGSPDAMHPMDRLRMRLLLAMSLGAMILCVLPVGIALLGAEGDTLWRICNGSVVVAPSGRSPCSSSSTTRASVRAIPASSPPVRSVVARRPRLLPLSVSR